MTPDDRDRGDTIDLPRGADRPNSRKSRAGLKNRLRKYWWLILMVLLAISVIGIAAYTGLVKGETLRAAAQESEHSQALLEQYGLGIKDLMEGRYDLAKQRAEFILSVDPSFVDAIELLDLARRALEQPTITPTSLATPTQLTPTPTPDLSSLESHYAAASAAIGKGDWDVGLSLLIDLRADNPDYRSSEVNQLMFSGLRNRGFEQILSGFHEQGIYDLTLAERFQDLDPQALSWRRSAEFYLFANSHIGLDWAQAYQSFAELCGAAIWDSCFKFATSAQGFGDDLLLAEDPCGAITPYEQSLLTFKNEGLNPTATEASILCMTATAPTPTETPTLEGTITPTPDETISPGTETVTLTPPPASDTPSD